MVTWWQIFTFLSTYWPVILLVIGLGVGLYLAGREDWTGDTPEQKLIVAGADLYAAFSNVRPLSAEQLTALDNYIKARELYYTGKKA